MSSKQTAAVLLLLSSSSFLSSGCGGAAVEVDQQQPTTKTPDANQEPSGPIATTPPVVDSPPTVTPGAVVCGVAAPACSATPSFAPSLVDAVKTSSVGFRGTVTRLGDSTEPSLQPADRARAAVVRVDSVLGGIEGNKFLASFVGKEITVLSAAAPTVTVGYVGYFFAQSSIIGTGVVVTEIAHALPSTYPAIETDVPAIVVARTDRALYDRLAKASVIAVATVETTKSLNTPIGSEHSPDWNEGSVAVSCAVKGQPPANVALPVRFAASSDIMWQQAPKLTPSQTAAFVLADDDVTNVPGKAYVVVDARDVQPTTSLTSLVKLLACPPPVL